MLISKIASNKVSTIRQNQWRVHMDKEYLYHGSPVRVDKLIPNQAYDTGFEEIVPEEVIEINVDEYLDYCIIE